MTATVVVCPTCGVQVEWGAQSPYRPFCCERCKLIDLGVWAAEEHAIPGDELEDELFSADLSSRQH